METNRKVEIEICMGSSCFARGNNKTVEILKKHIAATQSEAEVHIKGALCKGRCKEGPIVTVDGKEYAGIDGAALVDLVKDVLTEKKP